MNGSLEAEGSISIDQPLLAMLRTRTPNTAQFQKRNAELKGGEESYPILLGHLDPIDSITGIKARLKSLGYYRGPVDNDLTVDLKSAILKYQKSKGLTQSSEANSATQDAIKSDFGS
jgi:peptidoglycan hydrolase-like protein with peptidoglycan-binding domain